LMMKIFSFFFSFFSLFLFLFLFFFHFFFFTMVPSRKVKSVRPGWCVTRQPCSHDWYYIQQTFVACGRRLRRGSDALVQILATWSVDVTQVKVMTSVPLPVKSTLAFQRQVTRAPMRLCHCGQSA
jgi:hypothetical protein